MGEPVNQVKHAVKVSNHASKASISDRQNVKSNDDNDDDTDDNLIGDELADAMVYNSDHIRDVMAVGKEKASNHGDASNQRDMSDHNKASNEGEASNKKE